MAFQMTRYVVDVLLRGLFFVGTTDFDNRYPVRRG